MATWKKSKYGSEYVLTSDVNGMKLAIIRTDGILVFGQFIPPYLYRKGVPLIEPSIHEAKTIAEVAVKEGLENFMQSMIEDLKKITHG